MFRFKPSGSLVVALVALVMAMGGSAVAASLITSKQIKDGTISIKDLSKKTVRSLKGKTGPRGLQGPAGAQGAKGDAGTNGTNGTNGAPGPSHSYTDIASNPPYLTFDSTASHDTTVASVSVPAGSYVISTNVLANNNKAADATLTCRLEGPTGTVIDEPNEVVFILSSASNNDRNWFHNTAARTFSGTTTISEICHTTSDSGVYSAHSLIATQVGALN